MFGPNSIVHPSHAVEIMQVRNIAKTVYTTDGGEDGVHVLAGRLGIKDQLHAVRVGRPYYHRPESAALSCNSGRLCRIHSGAVGDGDNRGRGEDEEAVAGC